MPGVAPVAAVGVERCRRVGAADLVLGCGEGGAFGRVFAFAAYRAFGGVVHRESSGTSHHRLLGCSGQNLSRELFDRPIKD